MWIWRVLKGSDTHVYWTSGFVKAPPHLLSKAIPNNVLIAWGTGRNSSRWNMWNNGKKVNIRRGQVLFLRCSFLQKNLFAFRLSDSEALKSKLKAHLSWLLCRVQPQLLLQFPLGLQPQPQCLASTNATNCKFPINTAVLFSFSISITIGAVCASLPILFSLSSFKRDSSKTFSQQEAFACTTHILTCQSRETRGGFSNSNNYLVPLIVSVTVRMTLKHQSLVYLWISCWRVVVSFHLTPAHPHRFFKSFWLISFTHESLPGSVSHGLSHCPAFRMVSL